MLAMDVCKQQPGLGNQRCADRAVVQKGAGAAATPDHPPEYQRLGWIALDAAR